MHTFTHIRTHACTQNRNDVWMCVLYIFCIIFRNYTLICHRKYFLQVEFCTYKCGEWTNSPSFPSFFKINNPTCKSLGLDAAFETTAFGSNTHLRLRCPWRCVNEAPSSLVPAPAQQIHSKSIWISIWIKNIESLKITVTQTFVFTSSQFMTFRTVCPSPTKRPIFVLFKHTLLTVSDRRSSNVSENSASLIVTLRCRYQWVNIKWLLH